MGDYTEPTTIRELIREALVVTGEQPEDLDCYYQDGYGDPYEEENLKPTQCSSVRGLPEREYDTGFGGINGPPFIAFSEKYVYISVQYDGAETIEAIPRHPEFLGRRIPWPGG